jgi:mannose/fructose/N-acetylgalactosamine-specific phosphotransferase system component IID
MQGESGVIESLRSVASIMRGFVIAALISTSIFLNISTQCVSEYMVFNIYSDSFADEQSLAKFFGLMSGALNFIGMAIGLWATDRSRWRPVMRHAVAAAVEPDQRAARRGT